MFDSSSTTRTRSASLTVASLRRRSGREGHLRGVLGSVVPPPDRDLVVRLVLSDGGGEVGRPGDLLAVDREDGVALLDAGLRGRSPVGDVDHVRAVGTGLRRDAEERATGNG